jgi:hypothetical protein
MQNWQHFANPRFALGFMYPSLTPQGHIVERAERQGDEVIRVHFTSKDSHELYFEMAKYINLSPPVEYQRHKESLEKRPDRFIVSELKEIRWLSQSAYEYSLKWKQGTRTVRLIEADNVTYRILYDPYSPLNVQVLSTVQWTY